MTAPENMSEHVVHCVHHTVITGHVQRQSYKCCYCVMHRYACSLHLLSRWLWHSVVCMYSCVLFAVMQVSQLAGYVSEHSAYHHGDVSLTSTIVGMAQNFVGSNNINLLYPSGLHLLNVPILYLCIPTACCQLHDIAHTQVGSSIVQYQLRQYACFSCSPTCHFGSAAYTTQEAV